VHRVPKEGLELTGPSAATDPFELTILSELFGQSVASGQNVRRVERGHRERILLHDRLDLNAVIVRKEG